MPFIGNQPAESYASFETETFSVSATTNYTLSHAVTNENEIRLVINGVVQQPGSGKAYTASGTTLTLTSATVSGDVMYAVYLGRALQTVNPPAASVGNSQTAPTIITGQTAETSIATDDTILIHDTSASALRKMTRANFVSGIGGTNTPMFMAYLSANQSVSDNTIVKVQCNTEAIDTDNAYDNSTNYRFTVPSGAAGKYLIYAVLQTAGSNDQYQTTSYLYKNGSVYSGNESNPYNHTGSSNHSQTQWILDLSEGDYLEFYGRSDQSDNAGANFAQTTGHIGSPTAGTTYFGGYKLIT
jgi:hypothetical protein